MPEEGLAWLSRADVLTYEEITRVVEAAASVGVKSIRLTGGEPLVRRDLPHLVESLASVPGVEDISLSTNGILLAPMAATLRDAGLTRVNISLDTLREDRFFAIARREGLPDVLAGIDAAIAAGLAPLKLNCVVMRGQNDDELQAFAQLTVDRPLFVRFIEVMPVTENLALQRDAYVCADEMLERIAEIALLRPTAGPGGNGPARYYALPGAQGALGVISPLSHEYCERCNRVRLSADGKLRLCLFGDQHVDFRAPLRAGAGTAELAGLLANSLLIKPERHHLALGEASSRMRAFSEIGG